MFHKGTDTALSRKNVHELINNVVNSPHVFSSRTVFINKIWEAVLNLAEDFILAAEGNLNQVFKMVIFNYYMICFKIRFSCNE